jgi:hypothetical protein
LLSARKDVRERKTGATGRPSKSDIKGGYLMLFVYCRLYFIYSLDGFLFDSNRNTICNDIQKIESLIRKCISILYKKYKITKGGKPQS